MPDAPRIAETATTPSPTRQALGLCVWLLLCFAASAGAIVVSIDGWYEALEKPWWNPPGWLFGPVWSALYVAMAVAAWLVWRTRATPARRRALQLFLLQWLLNALWTPLFFGLHSPALALVDILALALALIATIVAFLRVHRIAAALLIPYLLWVGFAGALNATIWWLNR